MSDKKKYNAFISLVDNSKLVNGVIGKEAKLVGFSALRIEIDKANELRAAIEEMYNVDNSKNLKTTFELFDVE
ncbi:MAG: hypothetical protein KAS32_11065 [Candidatus Peribacteraceae bacterium]|nr:hypothetical protein [Candidatus Peribacteraceae bacterium]